MNSNVNQILAEVHKVIVGKDDVMEKILMTLISRGHVLLDDVPGTGKTTAALAFHRALGLRYGRIQFTPDVLPSDIVGFSIYRKESGTFVYQPGAVMTNLLLADEINRTSSKTQAALLEVMEERQVTVDGVTSSPRRTPSARRARSSCRRLSSTASWCGWKWAIPILKVKSISSATVSRTTR